MKKVAPNQLSLENLVVLNYHEKTWSHSISSQNHCLSKSAEQNLVPINYGIMFKSKSLPSSHFLIHHFFNLFALMIFAYEQMPNLDENIYLFISD